MQAPAIEPDELRLVSLLPSATELVCFCAEWIDPLFCAGHWVPEMVEIAGGTDVLGRKWADSVRVGWDDVRAAAPEVIILMPCGFQSDRAQEQAASLLQQPGWDELPAVRNDRVFAVDGGYFNRPGLRVVEGTELLAHLLHPEQCDWNGPADAFLRIDPSDLPLESTYEDCTCPPGKKHDAQE